MPRIHVPGHEVAMKRRDANAILTLAATAVAIGADVIDPSPVSAADAIEILKDADQPEVPPEWRDAPPCDVAIKLVDGRLVPEPGSAWVQSQDGSYVCVGCGIKVSVHDGLVHVHLHEIAPHVFGGGHSQSAGFEH